MTNIYYKAPSDEIFKEVLEQALLLWESYDDTYGYATEKKNRIKDIGNIKDNMMYIVAMFDDSNQFKLSKVISPQAREAIHARIVAGGGAEYSNFK